MAESETLDSLHHVAVVVRDIQEAVDWYTRTFRCRVAYQDATWALLGFGNLSLAFVLPGHHPPHVGVAHPDPGRFGEAKTHRDGTRYVYLTDPSGNTVEILSE
jgi:catechol 2,3-dioxygenase-like lactoylglutathione lyase family enzyme